MVSCREFTETQWFARKVDQLLKSRGKSRAWLASELGISPPAVCILLKRSNPKMYTCATIARILGVEMKALIPDIKV